MAITKSTCNHPLFVLDGLSGFPLACVLRQIGARIRETSRRVWIHMASGYPYQRLFASAVETLKAART